MISLIIIQYITDKVINPVLYYKFMSYDIVSGYTIIIEDYRLYFS
jgi:hypothetical protein